MKNKNLALVAVLFAISAFMAFANGPTPQVVIDTDQIVDGAVTILKTDGVAANDLSNVTPATGRAALGLGTMAVATSTDYVATSSLAARVDTVNASFTGDIDVVGEVKAKNVHGYATYQEDYKVITDFVEATPYQIATMTLPTPVDSTDCTMVVGEINISIVARNVAGAATGYNSKEYISGIRGEGSIATSTTRLAYHKPLFSGRSIDVPVTLVVSGNYVGVFVTPTSNADSLGAHVCVITAQMMLHRQKSTPSWEF